MSREFENLSGVDLEALALARTWGAQVDQGLRQTSQEAVDAQLPQYSVRPAREISRRQIRDRDGKPWKARDAGQLFAQDSFVDRTPE